MTHDETRQLLKMDLERLVQGTIAWSKIAEALQKGTNLRIRVQLMRDQLHWVIVELIPGTENDIKWAEQIPFGLLPATQNFFKESGAFKRIYVSHVKKVMMGLREYAKNLGIADDEILQIVSAVHCTLKHGIKIDDDSNIQGPNLTT